MTHDDIKILISAYADGEVTPSEKDIVEEHLAACAECQKDFKTYKAMSTSLSKWSNETLSPDEEINVQKSFEQRREPMFTKRTAVILATTLFLVILIVTVPQIIFQKKQIGYPSSDIGDTYPSVNPPQYLHQTPLVQRTGIQKPMLPKIYQPLPVVNTRVEMQLAFNKGAQGRLKAAADDIGDQYSSAVQSRPMQLAMDKKDSESSRAKYGLMTTFASAPVGVGSHQEYWGNAQVGANANLGVRASLRAPEATLYDANTYRPNYWNNPVPSPVAQWYPVQPYPMPYEEPNTEQYDHFQENTFLGVKDNPLSTFSIDVDTASYSNLRRFLMQGQLPPKDAVHIEEMINYFHYDYPQPGWNVPFSITTELTPCPWMRTHQLALVGLQGKKITLENLPPSNLVLLVDVSGSMGEDDKLPLVKSALHLLVEQLRPEDSISLAIFSGAAQRVLEPTSGRDKDTILNVIDNLQAGGSTNGEDGLELAYQMAKENFKPNGNNRIIVTTDGDFNVGTSNDGELIQMIEKKREEGTYLTVLGFGMGNLKASRMEKLADSGNGNYAYIDSMDEARKVLVAQLGGTIDAIAKDVKVQVEFNPALVKAYRLIGYEKRMLKKEDFNNDKKDAGELGAGGTVTALYEIVPANSKESFGSVDALKYQSASASATSDTDEVMTVKLRYKNPKSKDDKSKLIVNTIKNTQMSAPGSENIRFAAAVAEFGMLLRDSEYKGTSSYLKVINEAQLATGEDKDGQRAEFLDLVQKAGLMDHPIKPSKATE